MEAARRSKWVLLAVLVVFGIVFLTVRDISADADQVYAEAVAAAAADDWVTAFRGYRRVSEIDPGFQDASHRALLAAEHLVAEAGGDFPEGLEVDLLRWLTDQQETSLVAALLDMSTVEIDPGWGTMGSSDGRANEHPARTVYVDRFAMDRYEVTNAQYTQFVLDTDEDAPHHWPEGRYLEGQDIYPVLGISWSDAIAYCEWVGKRLPTEAEWERACRGQEGLVYPWGDRWEETLVNAGVRPVADSDQSWSILTEGTSEQRVFPEPVGSRPEAASLYGVMDLCGNASEWVADWYDADAYGRLSAVNPVGDGPPWNHSVRGSPWLVFDEAADTVPDLSRCAFRNASHTIGDPRIGFRCAVSL